MGQRSQIYIRYNVNDVRGSKTDNPITVNYHGFIARYFQWNYGERMISRARGIIEAIHDEYMKYPFLWKDPTKLVRLCDVNFDMRDIVLSSDILQEVSDYYDGELTCIFNQDNNDGQLLIDVTNSGIKYCFIDGDGNTRPMDGNAYMHWDRMCEADGPDADWRTISPHFTKGTIAYTERNIKKISRLATLMTSDEVSEFINADYSEYVERKEDMFDVNDGTAVYESPNLCPLSVGELVDVLKKFPQNAPVSIGYDYDGKDVEGDAVKILVDDGGVVIADKWH